jgi:uncharacterized protein
MLIEGEYLGMPIRINDMDRENQEFFAYCAKHQFHLQRCDSCSLLRYPPTTACPWCADPRATWAPVEGKGTLHSYGEVHQAIQPVFRQYVPYMLLLVELDTQAAQPTEHEALRITGNLATPDGELAPPELVRKVGIGSRLRLVFKDAGEGVSLPLWTIDEEAEQPELPWRYPSNIG